ncbi:MAG: primase alpha helix C-terminal domain-containing protein, partial [bacterium]
MYAAELSTGKETIDLEKTHKETKDNEKIVKDFLTILFGEARGEGYLVLWTKQDKRSYFFSRHDFDDASKKAVSLSKDMDIYFGVGLQGEEPKDGGRGREDTVISIPGLWLDIDIKGPNHVSEGFPPDRASVKKLLDMFHLKPTVVVKTGGGYHIYWLFNEPMILYDRNDREIAKDLSSAFQNAFQYFAAGKGWKIDNTSDLSRLLRLPGTTNHKNEDPIAVQLQIHIESNRYDPSQIAVALKEYETDATTQKQDDSKPIEEGSRNTTLTSIGGKLRAQGLGYEKISEELIKINSSRCLPPLSEEEVEGIASSVSEYEVNENTDCNRRDPTQAERLVELADNMELFHTPDGECYAEFFVNEHKEIWPLKSKEFRHYLSKTFFDRFTRPPGSQGLQNALETLHGKAQFDAPQKKVFVRLAPSSDSVFLDLCNDSWEAVEISPHGWQIVKNPPISFRRPKGMLALPTPQQGGNISELRNIINVKKEKDWVLIFSWLIGAFSPSGPYPILLVHGEQGSAKSTTARILRELIDPSAAPLRTLPRSERDLMIMAKNSWVIAFDNLSGVRPWLSDALCRLSTGGGFSTRGLHTDSDEVIFDAERPILLNGIDDIANRQDLASRSLIINLPRIPQNKRKPEHDLWREFERMRPRIIGSILDTISFSLRNLDNVNCKSYPRMADFAKWIVASEPNLPWDNGKFIKYYQANQKESA